MFRRGFKTWAEQTALRVREKLKLAPSAPLDPLQLAALLSVPVLGPEALADLPDDCRKRLLGRHNENWSAITVGNGGCHLIVVNPEHASTRQNSNLAHELAHIILGHEPSMMFVSAKSTVALRTHNKEQEDEANWLAGCLLLPRDALLLVRRKRIPDVEISATYQVSPAMLRFRLNASGVDVQLRRSMRSR